MAFPENNGETTELADSGSPSGPPTSSTGSASGRGFNWRNRWVFIGGGTAAVAAVVVVLVAVLLTGGGSGVSSSALKLVPENTEVLFLLDMESIRSRQADFPGD